MDNRISKTIRKRFFNHIKVDEERCVLTKTSDEYLKLIAEANWYLNIPKELQAYTPRVVGHSLDPQGAYLEMEYLDWPTLGSFFIAGYGDPGFWDSSLKAVFAFMHKMRAISGSAEPALRYAAREQMFVEKTRARLSLLQAESDFQPFFVQSSTINGRSHASLNEYLAVLPALCEKHLLGTSERFSIIHGDLCAGNILCDPLGRDIRVIDPRGDFGGPSLYGDYRYDMAKLLHSFNGLYDFVVAGIITDFEQHGTSVSWKIPLTSSHDWIRRLCCERLRAELGREWEATELIEALLFLSMVPLHRESRERQVVLLAIGIEKFERFAKLTSD